MQKQGGVFFNEEPWKKAINLVNEEVCSIINSYIYRSKKQENVMDILEITGTDKSLYPLVGPLVMNPKVLKQNYNFPFRTAENFIWFVAVEGENVLGFVPLECKRNECVINNYFVWNKDEQVLATLLENIISKQEDVKKDLTSVAFVEDADAFKALGFVEEKRWTRYVKMRKEAKKEAEKE